MSVLASGLVVDHRAESLVGVSDVDDEYRLSRVVAVAHQCVREEGLSAAGRSHYEGVVVGHVSRPFRSLLHVDGHRNAADPVAELHDAPGDALLEGLADACAQASAQLHGHQVVL